MNQFEPGSPPLRELDFEPPMLLRSPHVQSIVGSHALRGPAARAASEGLRAASRPRLLQCSDGTRLEALISRHDAAASGRPVVVVIHGWHGCGDSLHVLSPAGRLFAAGFDVVRLHLRDHGGTQGLNEELFHSCRIEETLEAVQQLHELFAAAPMAVLGFSLGGNFAVRIGLRAPAVGMDLARVVGVCPVLEPGATMAALDAGWFGYRVYFLRGWREHLEDKRLAFPDSFDFSETRGLSTITDMTHWFVARHTPYPDTDSYLADYTLTGATLADLQVPASILTALDDPVIPGEGLSRLAPHPLLDVAATRYGGHCGFVADMRLSNWMDDELLRLLGDLLV